MRPRSSTRLLTPSSSSYSKVMWHLVNDVDMDRHVKAALVRKEGMEFVRRYVLANKPTPTTYIHQLLVHLPEQIESLELDPWYLQMQALEHKHKLSKGDIELTNVHKESEEVFMRKAKDGRVKSGAFEGKESYAVGTGKAVAHQLLKMSLLRGNAVRQERMLFYEELQKECADMLASGRTEEEVDVYATQQEDDFHSGLVCVQEQRVAATRLREHTRRGEEGRKEIEEYREWAEAQELQLLKDGFDHIVVKEAAEVPRPTTMG